MNTKQDGQPRSLHTPARNPYRAQKLYRYRKAHGITVWTDSELVRAHVEYLYSKGLTRAMIARAAGVNKRAIENIEDGLYGRTINRVAAAILAVTHKPHPRQELVPAIGVVRRVHALNAIGWPTERLAAELGINHQSLTNAVRKNTIVTYKRWRQIADLYESLSATPGPSERTRRRAQRNNWAAPLDWEYLDIDDPDITPEPATTTPRRILEQQKRDRDNQIREAINTGRPLHIIAKEVGISIDHLRRIRTNTTPRKKAA